MEQSTEQKKLTGEEKIEVEIEQVNEKLETLYQKPDKTDDEKKEIETLKQERKSRYQDKINLLTKRAKSAEENYGVVSDEVQELREEIAALKATRNTATVENNSTVVIGDKAYHTDEALEAMVAAEKMTAKDAYKYQRDRDKAELKMELKNDFEKNNKVNEEEQVRRADAQSVLEEYPQFAKKLPDGSINPDFQPDDPLYQEAIRIYNNGYKYNPKGLSESIKEAKKILNLGKKNIDMSEHHNVGGSNTFGNNGNRQEVQKVEFSKDEEETAVRLYQNQINPATRRQYTDGEAIARAKSAKAKRFSSRRVQ